MREIAYRVNQALTVRRMGGDISARKIKAGMPSLCDITTEHLKMPLFVMDTNRSILDGILGGKVFSLGEHAETIEQFESRWSGTYFSDVRLTRVSPDIRSVWEPSRLQHLTILLVHSNQNRSNPGIAVFKSFARERLIAWICRNPFLNGPHYMSAMECGLRMPVFFYALAVLDDLTPYERNEILEALYLHAWWVMRNLSLYSSIGNHTICECVGLIFAGAVFNGLEEGRTWLERAVQIMEHEVRRQILGDGGPIEQSIAYHRFIIDLFWLASDFLKKNTLHDCLTWEQRLSLAEAYLNSFDDGKGSFPSIGDSDDGHAIAPGIAPNRLAHAGHAGAAVTFSESGYTLIRIPEGGLLSFDHGPLGMPPLFNHGHADALSLTLSLGGKQFLIDAGTYQYNGAPEWRRYFKGTRAHNTVSVDGLDQAIQDTGFVWSRPYTVRLLRNQRLNVKSLVIEAEHDGYMRLDDPVVHRRAVLTVDDCLLLVRDRFEGRDVHSFELNWHFHPYAEIIKENEWWRIENNNSVLHMRLAGEEEFRLLHGSMDPRQGWYSPQYGMRVSCPVLTLSVRREPEKVEFITVMRTGPGTTEGRLEEALCRLRMID